MSNCWCKCEAGIGQCGPKVPRLKSLFNAHKHSDELSLRRGDRQAELQVIWEEIGEDKVLRLEELRQVVAVAVDKAYDKALEESGRRKKALKESVANSEARLKDLLGPYDFKAVAPRDLPLQVRLNSNMARLHELDSARVGGYGWVGGLVVMVELRRRLIALRETLKLPPCDTSADLDEVLANTMEALSSLYPSKVVPAWSFTVPSGDQKAGEQKPIFQRLKRFYQALRAIEHTWIESFAQKSNHHGGGTYNSGSDEESSDDERFAARLDGPAKTPQIQCQEAQDKRNFWDRSKDTLRLGKESSPSTPMTHFQYLQRTTRSKFRNSKNKITRQKSRTSDEVRSLELLSHKIFDMLEELNRHAKTAVQSSEDHGRLAHDVLSPAQVPLQFKEADQADEKNSGGLLAQQDQESESGSFRKGSCTPTSVLPSTPESLHPYHVHFGAVPLLWPPPALMFDGGVQHKSVSKGKPANSVVLDAMKPKDFSPEPPILMGFNPMLPSLLPPKASEHPAPKSVTPVPGIFNPAHLLDVRPVDLFGAKENSKPRQTCEMEESVSKLQPVQKLSSSIGVVTSKIKKDIPFAPPPPPSYASGTGSLGSIHPHPPPPPPPPPPFGRPLARGKKASKLRRSAKMGVLYRTMKGKVEGRHSGLEASPGRSVSQQKVSGGVQGGMADALAEITKRSAYFQQIEGDVQQHAECILETKVAIECFETSDMDHLLRFHESVEIQLEDLTDETQVLARFEGFPTKKLETIRLAGALYSKLLCMAQHIEKWKLDLPAAEQLDKVTVYFGKVKKEVETVERNKEEDERRFLAHKIQFNFSIVVRIKEAMVGLASRCVVMALEESKRVKSTIQSLGGNSAHESNRRKICLHILWAAFQLSYRVYNFAGGCDDETEKLTFELANEMETYPSSAWL